MDTAMNNVERAERLRAFTDATYGNGDIRDDLADLLADALHLAAIDGVDFGRALATARTHFEHETT